MNIINTQLSQYVVNLCSSIHLRCFLKKIYIFNTLIPNRKSTLRGVFAGCVWVLLLYPVFVCACFHHLFPEVSVCALGLHCGGQHHAVHGHIHLLHGLHQHEDHPFIIHDLSVHLSIHVISSYWSYSGRLLLDCQWLYKSYELGFVLSLYFRIYFYT